MKKPSFLYRLLVLLVFGPLTGVLYAQPSPGDPPPSNWLDWWSFSNTNTWATERGRVPVSFTNLAVSPLGNGTAVVLDNANPAWLRYNVRESDGSTNLTVNNGTVMLWFAPAWASANQGGTGPGTFGRLIEAGSYTTNASSGWWSLYLDPQGTNLTFAAQTNGSTVVYLSAPVSLTTNRWHLIALTYSETNTSLYFDGALATNGPGMTVWPSTNVLNGGFYIGSDNTGVAQARGMIDDVFTYSFPMDAQAIMSQFTSSYFVYYLNPANFANLSSAPFTATYTPIFNAIGGSGFLTWMGTNASCVTSTNLWLTNVTAALQTNAMMNMSFGIAGGADGLLYDIFANSILVTADSTNAWAWMGQGLHCNSYALTDLASSAAFLIAGKPIDSDGDGLSDAYERLVSKTDPNNPDSDGDGMLDGWEALWGTDPNSADSAQAASRSNYLYDSSGWLNTISGIRGESIGRDNEGNIQTAQ